MKASDLLLVYLCTFGVWVAANPLAQLLLQAHPNLLQNGFNNIPNLQLPFQQPKYDTNPYSLSFPYMPQKSVDNCLSQPNYQAPNPISQQINQLKSGDRQLNKLLANPMIQMILDPKMKHSGDRQLNELLSNPIIQMILDPKTKIYNQDGAEVAKQSINLPNTGVTPNVINNYYIITPECLDANKRENARNIKQVKDQDDNKTPRNNNTKNKQKSTDAQIRINHDRKRGGTSEKVQNQQTKIAKIHDANQNIENPKKSYNLENNNIHGNRKNNKTTIEHNNNSRRSVKKTQDKSENISKSAEVIKENSDSKHNEKILTYQNQNTTKENSKSRRRKKLLENLNNSSDNINKEISLIAEELPFKQETKVSESLVLKKDDNKYENGMSSRKENDSKRIKAHTEINQNRRSKDEAVIKEIHKKFPGIPEDVIKKLLNYLRRQLRKQGADNSCLQNTNYALPLRYDQLFPQFSNSSFKNHKSKQTTNRRRNSSSRRNHNKRRKQEHVDSEVLQNTIPTKSIDIGTDIEFTTIPSTTNSLTDAYIENNTSMNNLIDNAGNVDIKECKSEYPSVNFNIETEKLRHSTRIETTEINNSYKFPELGEEDVVNIFPENFVDDYYPDFRTDNIYLDDNENKIRNFRHDRYYYTTDRNVLQQKENISFGKGTEIHYKSYKPETIARDYNNYSGETDVKIYKTTGDSSETPLSSLKDTSYEINDPRSSFKEIEFKSPPVLENPDFETKPITARTESPYYRPNIKNSNDDKSTVGKFSTYSMAKQVDISSKPRTKTRDNVETVFVKSKVVKYGQNDNSSNDSFAANESQNNDTVLVFAQSIYADD